MPIENVLKRHAGKQCKTHHLYRRAFFHVYFIENYFGAMQAYLFL